MPEGDEVKLVRPYAVTFYPNSGDGTMKNQPFFDGEMKTLTANTFTRSDYTFNEWNTQADGNGTSYGNGEEITLTDDLILYAQWKAIPYDDSSSDSSDSGEPTYSITPPVSVTGGTVTVSPRHAEEGDTVTITTIPDESYELAELRVIDGRGREQKLKDRGDGEYTFKMPALPLQVQV